MTSPRGPRGPRGLIVAAPASGSGKTVLTAALLRALAGRGHAVSAFKVGPDYIDPAFHAAASGRACHNLDLWAMRPATLTATLAAVCQDASLVVGEGAMGLFDGAGHGGGSSADLAQALGLPVVLAVDASGQGASVAALVAGFRDHRQGLRLAGVIFNRVASRRHFDLLAQATRPLAPVLGSLPRDSRLALPRRHLGLVQAAEQGGLDAALDAAAALAARYVDLDALLAAAAPLAPHPAAAPAPLPPPGQRIALACDRAFAFAYPAMMAGWRAQGAEVVPFSPLADEAPDAAADAVWLPGGYPELHAATLAAHRRFMAGLRRAAATGAAVIGECGGFMVLGEGLIAADGRRHAMAGLLPLSTAMAALDAMPRPRPVLGYRRMTLARAGPLGPAGRRFRGHEFHYARLVEAPAAPPLFHATDVAGQALGAAGAALGRVAGSFLHIVDGEDECKESERLAADRHSGG